MTDLGKDTIVGSAVNFGLIDKTIGDNSIILVGDAAHGAGNIHRFVYDLFRHLVHEKKANCLLIEANFNSVLAINRLVADPDSLSTDSLYEHILKLPFMHRTNEFRDLVVWMHNYNRSQYPDDRIYLYGIDVQEVEEGFEYLRQLITTHSPKDSGALSEMNPTQPMQGGASVYSEGDIETLRSLLEGIRNNPALASGGDFPLAERVLENVRACSHLYTPGNEFKRDYHMYENVRWIKDRHNVNNTRAILVSAHNGHVANDSKRLGEYIAKGYGNTVFTIGTDFGYGSITARKTRGLRTIPPFGEYEAALTNIDTTRISSLSNRVRLIQRARNSNPADSSRSVQVRNIGAVYNYDPNRYWIYWRESKLPESFDCVVYFDRVYPLSRL